ncbi:MAG: nuclear transport factor 2 family protein [Mycobacterium sp.]|nr:nuclear transport factor 2 family protein [Mycobacterium sp.]
MSDLTETVDTYLAGLNEADPDRRGDLIERAWTTDCLYVDPGHEARGRRAIGALAAGVQEQLPGHRFRRTSDVDGHHGRTRFGWELVGPDGVVAVAGIDVVELHGDGRLRRVTGFFGDLGAAT